MTYPRMNKEDYPKLPTMITIEDEYRLVLEYLVMAGIKLDELRHKVTNPILSEEKKKMLQDTVVLAENKYDQLCLLIDDYKRRHPHFAHARTVEQLRGVLK